MHRVLPTTALGRWVSTGLLRVLAGAMLAVSLSLAASSGAQAFTPNVTRVADHFFECLGLMLTDPAGHASQCGPSLIAPSNDSLLAGSGGSGAKIVCDAGCTSGADCQSGICTNGTCVDPAP